MRDPLAGLDGASLAVVRSMSPGPTFDRVYRALKVSLMTAKFAPGEHLEPVALGEKFHASATPVRDALQRLAGERLVEAPLHEGFRAPAMTEPELRDLFEWSLKLVDLALRRPAPAPLLSDGRSVTVTPSAPESAFDLFLAIVRDAASEAHLATYSGLCDRLAAIGTVEALLFDDLPEELAELQLLRASGNGIELRRGVAAYHRRRQRAAPELLAALRRETSRRR